MLLDLLTFNWYTPWATPAAITNRQIAVYSPSVNIMFISEDKDIQLNLSGTFIQEGYGLTITGTTPPPTITYSTTGMMMGI